MLDPDERGVVLIRLLGSFGCVCLLTIKFPNRQHSESVIFIRNIFEHIFKNVYFFYFFVGQIFNYLAYKTIYFHLFGHKNVWQQMTL